MWLNINMCDRPIYFILTYILYCMWNIYMFYIKICEIYVIYFKYMKLIYIYYIEIFKYLAYMKYSTYFLSITFFLQLLQECLWSKLVWLSGGTRNKELVCLEYVLYI